MINPLAGTLCLIQKSIQELVSWLIPPTSNWPLLTSVTSMPPLPNGPWCITVQHKVLMKNPRHITKVIAIESKLPVLERWHGMRYMIVIVVFGLQHVVESCLDSITVAIAVVRYGTTLNAKLWLSSPLLFPVLGWLPLECPVVVE